MSTPETDSLPRPVQPRQNFDQATVSAAIEEALAALGKATMRMPSNLAHELQHAHNHLMHARDWVRLYSPNTKTMNTSEHYPYFSPESKAAAVEACRAWLADKKKIKSPTFGTYWCKHRVEEVAGWPKVYIWEETFIDVALSMGFSVVNKRICMSRLSVRHLW